jgi:hypothetical protein
MKLYKAPQKNLVGWNLFLHCLEDHQAADEYITYLDDFWTLQKFTRMQDAIKVKGNNGWLTFKFKKSLKF